MQTELMNQSQIPVQMQDKLEKEHAQRKYLESENIQLKDKIFGLSQGFKQTDTSFKGIIQ